MQSQHPVAQQQLVSPSSSSSSNGIQSYPSAFNRELTFDPPTGGHSPPGFRGHSRPEHLCQSLRDDVIGVVSDSESEVYDDDDDNNDNSPKLSDTSCHDEILGKLDEKPKKSEEIDEDEGRVEEEVLKEQDFPPPRRGGRRRGSGCSSTEDSEKTDYEVDAKESRPDETMTTTTTTTIQHLLLSHSAALSTTGRSGPMKSGAKAPPTAAVDGEGEIDRSRNRLERFGGRLLLMDERFMPTPPPSASPLIRRPDRPMSSANGHHWTFEEQFKQLYEMSLEPKRKEFLDDLFSFMQRRGTPVNRIPIMAKQTLDLFGLFRLVVGKGGLVEVINKKLWREITKGLNLPSSITSAAFTLRTQYMKYLYPYECEKLKLSTLVELQAAIDGNRREGRRPGYGYDFSPLPAAMLSTPPVSHIGIPLHSLNSARPSPKGDDLPLLTASLRSGGGRGSLRPLVDHDARAMEAVTRVMDEEEASRAAGVAANMMIASMNSGRLLNSSSSSVINSISSKFNENNHPPLPLHPPPLPHPPSCKRAGSFSDEDHFLSHIGLHGNRFKMANHSSGRLNVSEETPMVVNMEINGLMYRGVLFAQHRL